MLIASLLYLATCCATGGVVPLPREPVIVSAAWLAQHASERNVVVLAVLHSEEEFERGHIPGARFIAYGDITTTRNGLMTELPDAARLRQIFESAGVTDDSRAIVYSDMPLMNIFRARAARGDTVVTYCYVGHRASMTYLVARALGYEAKLYDGSYQDWARRSLPLTTGDRP